MNYLKEALIALNSGLTQYRKGTKEIEWQDERGESITVEIVDVEKEVGVIRKYNEDRTIDFEFKVKSNKFYDKFVWFMNDGTPHLTIYYDDCKNQ